MREEQDCDASASQPANFRGGELVAFADARPGGTNLAIEYHDFIANSVVALGQHKHQHKHPANQERLPVGIGTAAQLL